MSGSPVYVQMHMQNKNRKQCLYNVVGATE